MKTRHPRQTVSIATAHFRGIKIARTGAAAAKRPRPAAPAPAAPARRVTFAGIGGGGRALPAIAPVAKADPAAARSARQRRIDALWDASAERAGIVPPKPG